MHNLWYLNMSKYTYTSRNYSKSWMSIRHRMSQKALLNTNLQRPITFHCLPAAPSDNSETTDNKQTLINKDNLRVNLHPQMVKMGMAKWVLMYWWLWGLYTCCVMNAVTKKGRESAAVKTGQGIKQKIKWLHLSIRSLGTLRYTSGIKVQYLENFYIWQTLWHWSCRISQFTAYLKIFLALDT
jgi:hypothetical protein